MPMLPAGPLKDSVQTFLATVPAVAGVLADTFRISYPVDTLQLHSTRRKQGTDKLLPASTFKNIYYGFSLTNGNPGVLYHSVGVNGAMYVNYTDEAYVRQLALLKPSLLIISLGTNETFGRRFRPEDSAGRYARLFPSSRSRCLKQLFCLPLRRNATSERMSIRSGRMSVTRIPSLLQKQL